MIFITFYPPKMHPKADKNDDFAAPEIITCYVFVYIVFLKTRFSLQRGCLNRGTRYPLGFLKIHDFHDFVSS